MPDNSLDVIQKFIGSWSLVSWRATSRDGSVSCPYGDDATGRIMYLPEGHMSACLMRRQRTLFASDNRHEATADERSAAYRDYMSYYGMFTVQESARTVTHHVEGATFPNWIGTDLVRSFRFADNMLILSLTRADGTLHELTWQRRTE